MLRTLTFTPWSGKPVVYRRRGVSADPVTVGARACVASVIDVSDVRAPSLTIRWLPHRGSDQLPLFSLKTQPEPLHPPSRRHPLQKTAMLEDRGPKPLL
jgi:hypothetical protein